MLEVKVSVPGEAVTRELSVGSTTVTVTWLLGSVASFTLKTFVAGVSSVFSVMGRAPPVRSSNRTSGVSSSTTVIVTSVIVEPW